MYYGYMVATLSRFWRDQGMLTKTTIEHAKPAAPGAQYFIADDKVRNLKLRVTAGSKSFVFERKYLGRTRRKTIGAWPEMNVLQARDAANRMLAKLADGIDPAHTSHPIKAAPSFGSLCAAYFDDRAAHSDKLLNRLAPRWSVRAIKEATAGRTAGRSDHRKEVTPC